MDLLFEQPLGDRGCPYGGTAFNGLIDEVEIFGRALSLAEIQAIYNAGTAGKCRSCTPPPSGMVSWWGGNNNSLDMIGTNNGTVNGATYAAGKVGQAFSLDGNDYIQIPKVSTWDFGTSSFSIDAWFKSGTAGPSGMYRPIIWYDNALSGGYWGVYFNPEGKVEFHIGPASRAGYGVITTNLYNDDNWHFVSAVRDSANGKLKLYIDGHPAASDVSEPGVNIVGAGDAYPSIGRLGSFSGYSGYYFTGLLDEVEIFSRALSASEIAAIYNAGSAGKCAPDTTPDPFPFDPVTGAARSTLYTSNTITISGINVPAEVTITGGEYSVGCTATFINTESTVVNGDTVCVRQTSSPNYSTPTTATLTIGEGSGDFNVTTLASHMLHAEAVPSAAKTFNPSSWEIGQGGNIGIDIEPNAAYYFVSATDNCGAGGAKIGAPNAGNTSYDISPVTADCTLTVTYAAYPVWRDGTTSYFMTMGAGYGDGSAAYTIKAHGVELTDSDLNLSGTAAVVLDGGYLADFSDYSGVPTTITGPFTIGGDGSITIKNIAVK
ncbi:MAG: LamG domain-containing protein [Nitrospirae bacterium]|nr:LamG domain-containing protein [Nitrospirota bacterium]